MIDKQYVIDTLRKKQMGTKGLVYSTYDDCIKAIKQIRDTPDQSRHVADLTEQITELEDCIADMKAEHDAAVEQVHSLKRELALASHKVDTLRAEIGILGSERLLLRELLKEQLVSYAGDADK